MKNNNDEKMSAGGTRPRQFPAFRLKVSLITSFIYTDFIIFSTLLDSFNLIDGFKGVENGSFGHFIFFFALFIVGLPLLILNIYIQGYLRLPERAFKEYFDTGKVTDEQDKAVSRLSNLNRNIGILAAVLFLLSNPWGMELKGAHGGVVFVFFLTRLSMVAVMAAFITICNNLFVMRRVFYNMETYHINWELKPFQKQHIIHSVVPIVLLVNAMALFADVSLRMAGRSTGRLQMISQRAKGILAAGSGAAGSTAALDGSIPIEKMAAGYGILILILLVQSALIFIFMGILQNQQIKNFREKVEELASGSGDLTQKIRIVENSDFGLIISALNRFTENLRLKLLTVQESSERVERSSNILLSQLQETSAATEEMVASVEQINRTTASRADIVDETGKSLISMIASLDQVKSSVDTQAEFVEQTSSAINEIAASIQSVSQSTNRANELSTHLSEAASTGGKAVTDSIAAVRDVEASSEEVNNLVSAITKIAGQTNMLAMNAAIEAAHAGDAGRGFAVVAEEVRNLAENSSGSARQITERIKTMVGVVNTGVEMSENAGKALQEVLNDIDQTTGLINGIAQSMEEQNLGASEILGSISSLVEATHLIRKIVQEEMSKNAEIRHSVDEVVQAFAEIRSATEEQSQGTRDMIQIVENLQNVARENQEVVKTLSSEFDGFKLK